MDYAESQIKAVIQSAIDKLLTTHKTHKDNDAGFNQAAYEILHTFMNNIHLTQSLIYTSLISKPFKLNPIAAGIEPDHKESLAQTVIKDEGLFVPRIIKTGCIPVKDDEKQTSSKLDINFECKPVQPTAHKQQTIDRWISDVRDINSSHYESNRTTPSHRRRYVEDAYADFYGYDNSLPQYYEPNEEEEQESNVGWTYTADEGPEDYYLSNVEEVTDYLSNCELARTVTPPMPEEFRNGVANFNMDVQQCCARIGKTRYDVEEKDPEFMDSYPADTYRDMQGYVYGLPCLNMIPNEDFEAGIIFCSSHNSGYEDIRSAPKIKEHA